MLDPTLARTAVALAVGCAAVGIATAAAGALPGEGQVLEAAHARSDGTVAAAARGVDAATGYAAVATVAGAFALGLLLVRRPATAARVTVAVTGTIAGTTLIKRVVERPRPELMSPLIDASPYSFPSGHAAGTAAVAVAAALALGGTRWFRGGVAAAAVLAVVTAAAQLALARHHPTDLVGGWLWAAAWTCAVWSVRGPAP